MDFPHKDKKRAERRSHKERKRHKIEDMVVHKWYGDASKRWDGFEEWKEKYIQRHADNPKSCSCWMCGNPRRKFHDLTLQEKKFQESIRCIEE